MLSRLEKPKNFDLSHWRVLKVNYEGLLLAGNTISLMIPKAVTDWRSAVRDGPLCGSTTIVYFRPEAVISLPGAKIAAY